MENEEFKYESGISGRAQVRFGGKIQMAIVSGKHIPVHGIALSEWFGKGGIGEEQPEGMKAHDTQVMILFDSIRSVDCLRMALDDVEAKFKRDAEKYEGFMNERLVTMGFSVRTLGCLKSANIERVGDLTRVCKTDLLKIRNFGKKCLDEVCMFMDNNKLKFRK